MAAALGCAVQVWGQFSLWPLGVYGAIFAAAVLILWSGAKLVKKGILAGLFKTGLWVIFAILGFAMTGARSAYLAAQMLPAHLNGRIVTLTGTVENLPQRTASGGMRWILATESVQFDGDGSGLGGDGEFSQFPKKVALSSSEALPIVPGQRWRFAVRLREVATTANVRGTGETALWWWLQGVRATGSVVKGSAAGGAPTAQLLGQTHAAPLQRWRHAVRAHMQEQFSSADAAWRMSEDAAGIVTALVTGDQAAMSAAQWQLWRTTGVVHLVSISGLHITMFAWTAMGLVQWLWARSAALVRRAPAPLAGLWAGFALAAAYAAFSGWGLPAQRTLLMLAAVVGMRTLGLRWAWPRVWAAVLALVVVWQPWALMQPGLWLSFVAVAILFGLENAPKENQNRAWHWLKELIKTQCVLTIALLPMMIIFFGQISLVGLIVNIFAVPWMTLLVTPMALLGMIISPLWTVAAWLLEPLLATLKVFAEFPHAVWYFVQQPRPVLAFLLLGLLGLALPLAARLRCLAVPLMLPALLWQPARPAVGDVRVDVFDVGQGAAAMVRTAAHTLLFDAGPRWNAHSDAGEAIVVPSARALGVRRLDAMVLSHGDADHMGGAASVLQALPTQAVWTGAGTRATLQAEFSKNNLQPQNIQDCRAAISWVWDNVHFEILHPKSHDIDFQDNNSGSCVLRIQTQDNRVVIFTGDIGLREEWDILQDYVWDETSPHWRGEDFLRADLLVAAHHGSASASSRAWAQATRAAVVVFQAGFANRWGHPAPVVRQRYREAGATLVNTAFCGAMAWESAAAPAFACQRTHQRYWDAPAWVAPDGSQP